MRSAADRLNRLLREETAREGTWRLTKDHTLVLSARKGEEGRRPSLFFKGALVDAAANSLAFSVSNIGDEPLDPAQRLTLRGRWQADARNRLMFLVDKADGSQDRLILQGGWGIGPHHELVYRVRQRRDGRAAHEQTVAFEGAWDITRSDRLVYRLAGSDDSSFEFRASLQSPTLSAADGRLVYRVGLGLASGQTHTQRLALFGAWKLHRDLSVSFEIPYANGRVGTMHFEGTYAPTRRDRVAIALSSRHGEPLGLTVTFTKDVMRDMKLFLQLRQEAEEHAFIGGVRVKF